MARAWSRPEEKEEDRINSQGLSNVCNVSFQYPARYNIFGDEDLTAHVLPACPSSVPSIAAYHPIR